MDGSDGAAGGSIGAGDTCVVFMDRHMGHQPHVGSHYVWHGTDTLATGF